MTTANATAEGNNQGSEQTGTEGQEDRRELAESIVDEGKGTDAGTDNTETDGSASEAMRAGWNKAGGKEVERQDDARTPKKGEREEATGTATELQDNSGNANGGQTADEDVEVPGLGKASDIKARLARLDTLEKTVATTSGHLGHLKQLVTQAGKGKTITKESLKHIASEFGDEYADALAKDLNAAGIGAGGATIDGDSLRAIVEEQVSAGMEARTRLLEKRAVLRAHPDADEHFSQPVLDERGQQKVDANGQPQWKPGKNHAAFMQFIGTLPAERQKELQENGWDSTVVTRALDDFKATKDKSAKEQDRQNARVGRAVVPTGSQGRTGNVSTVDPLKAGWNRVKGQQGGGARR